MIRNSKLGLMIALGALAGVGMPSMESRKTKHQKDVEKRTPADIQSRQDKNAAKRARRAARALK